MKNLKLLYSRHSNTLILSSYQFVLNSFNDKNTLYIISEDQSNVLEYNTINDEQKAIFQCPGIIGCEHLALSDELCIASELGDVYMVNASSKKENEVTFCKNGISRMAWSPDQEVVVFVTLSNDVVVMTSQFDPILESSLTDESFGDKEFITVGWGRKETQFHGSEGKQAALKKNDVKEVSEDIVTMDKTTTISWRGDSEMFAVSYIGNYGRMFKVYDKEGKLQFTSEKLNGLCGSLAWRPSGSWIAVPHNLPNKYTIALFEKNGLRHREIILPFKYEEEPVRNLSWSSDSDILTVETLVEGKSRLYLYTVCNYHWYLKQFLQFNSIITDCLWNLGFNEEKKLHILMRNGSYVEYKWAYEISHSSGDTELNQGIVAVIDGKKLLITDFRNVVVPPPMANYTLEVETYIQYCGFIKNPDNEKESNNFFIVTSNDLRFYNIIFEKTNFGHKLLKHVLLFSLDLSSGNRWIPLARSHWMWLSTQDILYIETSDVSYLETSKIFLISTDNNQREFSSTVSLSGYVGSVTNDKRKKLITQLTDGRIFSVNLSGSDLQSPVFMFQLPDFCEQIESFSLTDTETKLVSLKFNQNLYVNSTKICSDVTSFFLTQKYLAFTQLSCLKFLRISNNIISDERKIERGGKLITIIPFDSRTILQMPRGNLEAIHPRILSLDIIGDLLDKLSYKKAMDILRKERINLNIIVDHNPILFIDNINIFLQQITNPQWLNLFLSDLQNEDFSKTMYAGNYSEENNSFSSDYKINNKINFICEKMCKAMELKDYKYYLLPIITTYVKTGNLEKALDVIWSEKKKETVNNEKNDNKTKSDEALKYLLYLVDVNELYNVALGMYDFGLVLFVATKSQKDPKEYVPFLNELKQLDEYYRKFKIDEYLKRYDKALENISKCSEDRFEECFEFIQKHSFYHKALLEFEDNKEYYKRIALAFGDYLRSQGKHENASIMYERGGDLSQAILSAKHVLDWRRCLVLTNNLTNGDVQELQNISQSLIPALQDKGMFEEAFFVLKTYGSNFQQALSCLLRGRLYLKAIYEARMKGPELIERDIMPHLKEYTEYLNAVIQSDLELFISHKARLLNIRKQKAESPTEIEYEDGVDECDLLSDTSSVNSSKFTGSSNRTGKTFRSSKNRRKHERKLLSLKEGNPFEDIALVDALHNHIIKVFNQQMHIRETCKALIETLNDRDAKLIQKSYANLLSTMKDSLDEIWVPEMITPLQMIGQKTDYHQLQNEQRYAMINPQKRYKPQLNLMDWEHEILR